MGAGPEQSSSNKSLAGDMDNIEFHRPRIIVVNPQRLGHGNAL
jgi:hypothetical protein